MAKEKLIARITQIQLRLKDVPVLPDSIRPSCIPYWVSPTTQSNDLEPFLLTGHVGVVELCVALGEVDDAFDETDGSHDDRSCKEKD